MEYNIATGIFPGFNDAEGLMLCGYEWGGGDDEVELTDISQVPSTYPDCVFSNKASWYGDEANNWKYDAKIRDWFKRWGHELNCTEGHFEKCLLQTNWCNTQAHHMEGSYRTKLMADEQVLNFTKHIKRFKPKLILLLGSSMINFLQHEKVLRPFIEIMGDAKGKPTFYTKPFSGRRFKVGFQNFEKCKVVSLPHPSGSHGLSGDYISLFSTEIGDLIQEVKEYKKII